MLLATFSLSSEAIALSKTLQDFPEITIEAERIAAHSTEWTMPCLWIANADFDRIDESLRNDPSVDSIVETYEFDEEKYYQLDWSDDVVDRIDAYLDQEASLLDAKASDEAWRVRIRFASRDQFDTFCSQMDERDDGYELLELVEPGAPRQSVGRLTPGQRDALVAAVEHGYYEIPREASADELAAALGISQQALSERLRRATRNLVDSRLTTAAETSERQQNQ